MEMLVMLGWAGAVVMGITLGLIGGGGSILTVPILVYMLSVSPIQATAYSLFVVGLTALIGSAAYMKQRLVDFRTGAVFAVPSFIGVFLMRRYGVPALPEVIFTYEEFEVGKNLLVMGVFAIVMILASVSMIREQPQAEQSGELSYNYPLIAVEGLLVGGVTGFVGAGGGFLIIPALVVLAKLPMKQAVGTSLLIIALKSLFGFLGDLGNQEIDWEFLLIFSALATGGILTGTFLSRYIPGSKLKPAFGWFVLIMGLFILAKETVLK
ncbi:MAG: sulfite exporter TauE/SafE family protein [bacterium]